MFVHEKHRNTGLHNALALILNLSLSGRRWCISYFALSTSLPKYTPNNSKIMPGACFDRLEQQCPYVDFRIVKVTRKDVPTCDISNYKDSMEMYHIISLD